MSLMLASVTPQILKNTQMFVFQHRAFWKQKAPVRANQIPGQHHAGFNFIQTDYTHFRHPWACSDCTELLDNQ